MTVSPQSQTLIYQSLKKSAGSEVRFLSVSGVYKSLCHLLPLPHAQFPHKAYGTCDSKAIYTCFDNETLQQVI